MKYKFMDPEIMLTITISLIMIVAGMFAFFTLTSETEERSSTTIYTYNTVNDNPNTYTLPTTTDGINTVTEVYADGSSAEVPASNYTWNYNTPTTITIYVTGNN